jgi:hypothetical protein
MEKVDFKKTLKNLYQPSSKEVSIIEVPEMNYIMIDGHGDPNNSKIFEDAVEALYGISYTIKMMPKKGITPEGYFDYVVAPLEGLWSITEGEFDFVKRDNWIWTLMIMQPDFVDSKLFEHAKEEALKKKSNEAIANVRFESYKEGLSAQIMHHGPYAEEPATVDKIHTAIAENGYSISGEHHEIYLSDPRKAQQEKLKTVIRYPISKASN